MIKSEKGTEFRINHLSMKYAGCRLVDGMASHLIVLFLKKLKFILAIDDKYNIMNV